MKILKFYRIFLYLLGHGICFLLFFDGNQSLAQQNYSATALGTGGAGRAAIVAADINFMNPSALVHSHGRHFFFRSAPQAMMTGISEGPGDIILPASLAYYQESRALASGGQSASQTGGGQFSGDIARGSILEDRAKVKDTSLAFADYIVPRLAIGVTIHHHSILWPDTFDFSAHDQNYSRNYTDLGFLFNPGPNLGLGLVFTNFFGAENYNPKELFDLAGNRQLLTTESLNENTIQKQIGFGFNYIVMNMFRVRADLLSGPNMSTAKTSLMAGFEDFLNQWMIWRLGYQYDGIKDRSLGAIGLGFEGPKFGINYGYQQDMNVTGDSKHSIDLQLPF